jgi:antitoxin (DNA-binding transcriptional repressor) of toxin-antitoxin stability system
VRFDLKPDSGYAHPMNSTLSIEEAARDLGGLIEDVRISHDEAILTRNGTPVAKITAIGRSRTLGEIAERWQLLESKSEMNFEERRAFADDIEASHKLGNQPIVSRWD